MDNAYQVSCEVCLFHVQRFFETTQSVDSISRMILHQVFEYLPIQDIRNCRLVSRRWREISQKEWGARSLVRINTAAKMKRYITQFQNNLGAHTNFLIYSTTPKIQPTTRFLTIFGPHIKSLDIRKCFWTGRNFPIILDRVPNLESLKLVGHITKEDCIYPNVQSSDNESIVLMSKKLNWPKLKHLTMDVGGFAYDECMEDGCVKYNAIQTQPFLFQLLMASPNLETFNFYSPNDQCYPRMIFHLVLYRHEVKLKKLRKINTVPIREFSTNELHLLRIRSFPIAELNIDFDCVSTGMIALHGLLTSLGGTLKKLRIKYVHHHEAVASHFFPSSRFLQNLKSLTLINFLGNVGFVVELMNLEYLYMDHTTPYMVFGGLDPDRTFPFPVQIRFAPLRNRDNILDRAMYLFPNYGGSY